MRVHLHPQRRTVEVTGRRSVGRLLTELGVLPSTAMVIRRDELLTDGEMVEDDDEIEIRAVISGGCDDHGHRVAAPVSQAMKGKFLGWEHGRRSRPRGRVSEHGRVAAARTGARWGFALAHPLMMMRREKASPA
jgi:sulfur carrier protein